jgi:hypothetical protein
MRWRPKRGNQPHRRHAAFDIGDQFEKSGAQLSERRKEEARTVLAKSIIAEAKKGKRSLAI